MYLMSKKKSQKTSDEYIHKHKSYYYTTNERCFALDRFLIWKQNILLFFLITEALNCRMHQPQSFISNLWPLQCATPKKYFEWKTKNTEPDMISFQKKLENLLWQDSRTLLLSGEAALY